MPPSDSNRLPTALWLEAGLRRLDQQAISYYVARRGEYASGVVVLNINGLNGQCRVLTQERDIDGNLQWVNALGNDTVDEKTAGEWIARAIKRDPDLWVVEIENRLFQNPFDDGVG